MAEVLYVEPVIRFCAVISADADVRAGAIDRLTRSWGQLLTRSLPLPFVAGGYYADSMGENLSKELVAFVDPIDGAGLADWKQDTNQLEREFAGEDYPNARPLNLDPGYITQAKLVLATTKDRDHRIYLRDGMFAEITLNYRGKRWVHHRWTYPDYRTEPVAEFALQCRTHLRECLADSTGYRQRS